MATPATPQYFVSYAHEDKAWLKLLFRRSVSTTVGDCLIWNDTQLQEGQRWRGEIDDHLAGCTVAVLLVSRHFLDSKFIREQELPLILQRGALPAGDPNSLRLFWLAIGLEREAVAAELPELAAYQGALASHPPLPALPTACSDDTRAAIRQQVELGLQSAVDPLGAAMRQMLGPRYRVEQWVGAGSRATVYRAFDAELDRSVAIKVLRDLTGRQAFMADVKAALKTSEEPNFLNIYDVSNSADATWCVMQHFEGDSLRAHLQGWRDGTLARPNAEVLRQVFVKLLRAVERAHRMTLCYGNLMPSNIVLDREFEPFILPVGRSMPPGGANRRVAQLLDRIDRQQARGQPTDPSDEEELAYLVPEHFVDSDQPADARRTDIYMLGLLAWEMATGALPARVAQPRKMIAPECKDRMAEFGPLAQICDHRPLFPARLQALIQSMTQLLPAQRPADLKAVLDEPDLHDRYCLVQARDSWRRCMALDTDDQFFATFYLALTTRFPETVPFLNGVNGPERLPRQQRMLKQAVLMLFAFAQRCQDTFEPNLLSTIAVSHADIPPKLFDHFRQVLIGLVCGDAALKLRARDPLCAGSEDLASRLRQHWSEALTPGVAYLRDRAQPVGPAVVELTPL